MARQRAGDIAAPMQEQHDAPAIRQGRARPLRGHTLGVDRFDHHVRRQPVARSETVDPRAPRREVGRPRMRREAVPDEIDLGWRHLSLRPGCTTGLIRGSGENHRPSSCEARCRRKSVIGMTFVIVPRCETVFWGACLGLSAGIGIFDWLCPMVGEESTEVRPLALNRHGEAEPKPSSAPHDPERSRPWIASLTLAMTAFGKIRK